LAREEARRVSYVGNMTMSLFHASFSLIQQWYP
jgi:hypothetical protein